MSTGQAQAPSIATQLAPHGEEAEMAVLGSILINPEAYHETSFLKPGDFFLLRNSWVYEAIQRLHERGEVIEYLTVIDELRTQNRLSDIGGVAYITYLISSTPTSVHASAYGQIVARTAGRRRALEMAEKINELARDESADFNDFEKKIEAQFLGWLDDNLRIKGRAGGRLLRDIVRDDLERLKKLQAEGKPRGIRTRLDLDKRAGLLQAKKLYIYGQRTGGGKSVMALTIANAAMEQGFKVAYISLEMPEEEHVNRLVAMKTSLSGERQETGDLSPEEFNTALEAREKLMRYKGSTYFYIDETPALTVPQIRASLKRGTRMMKGLDLVLIDHMQLITVPGVNPEKTAITTRVVFDGIKNMAKELSVPVFGLVQFNRDANATPEKPPTLFDIWGGAAAEQAADLVMIGHRPEQYIKPEELNKPENMKYHNLLRVYCGKKRGGNDNWMVELMFLKERTMFVNMQNEGGAR